MGGSDREDEDKEVCDGMEAVVDADADADAGEL